MVQYKYFEQQGSQFQFKTDKIVLYSGVGTWFAVALFFLYFTTQEDKFGLYFAIFFIILGLLMLLKTTKKLTIDTSSRTVTDKHNAFTSEKTYSFDHFQRFYMATYYVSFIKSNCMGSIIFEKNGKEQHVTLVTTMFTAKPAQRAINEASEIMGVESGL